MPQRRTRDLLRSLDDDYLTRLAHRWLDKIDLPYDASGHIDKRRPWIWTGDVQKGYGRVSVTPPDGGKRRKIGAHQAGFYFRWLYLPPVVRHTAAAVSTLDVNPYCSLEGGSQADNILDRDERDGNASKGTRNGRSKLDPQKVCAAREAVQRGESVRSVARQMSVDPKTMRNAVEGRTWSHVECT
jgi:hypothetical protein